MRRPLVNYIPIFITAAIIIVLYLSLDKNKQPKAYIYELSQLKLKQLNQSPLDLTDFKGKFYILHIFSSWCSACKEDYTLLNHIKEETNTPIIGVVVKDKISKLFNFNIKATPYDYVVFDFDNKISTLLKNKMIPETIIINPDGIVIARYLGILFKEEVEKNIIPKILGK
ncbi:MAG: TlpA disulfide reductase family protein [Rickettsiales bacterium]